MDIQNSGFDQLNLYIDTEDVSVSLKGKMQIAKDTDNSNSTLDVKCARLQSVEINDVPQNMEAKNNDGRHCLCVPPLFFEQTEYELVIVPKEKKSISFYHEDPNINRLVKPIKGTNIWSGTINFRNNIGYSDYVIMVDGKEYLRICIEVFPSKISYQKDFQLIRDDVANEVYGLIFDYLNPTYSRFGISKKVQRNDFDFGIILDNLFKKIRLSLDIIVARPHHVLQKEYAVVPAYKVKRIDNKCIKWALKHSDNIQIKNRQILAERMMNVKKNISYDTKENRLTKHILQNIIRRIDVFKKLAKRKGQEHPLYQRIIDIETKIRMYLNNTFLANIEEEFDLNSMSLVFSSAPGYHELYRNNLLLSHGLDMTEQILNVHLKQISELYEYWCYIKLNCLLRHKYRLVADKQIVTSKDNFVVNMIKGQKSVIKYTNPRNNEKFEMLYNNSYRNNQTSRQKPDNVLCLYKLLEDGEKAEFKYVFDAKYRINYGYDKDELGEEIYKNATPGPKDDDINVMHRYRDAIVYGEGKADDLKYKREMFGAYVLFPYDNEEEYKNHKYYKSIATVNIGGLPFLPEHTGLVEKLLDELINESPFSAEERGILPRNIELELQEIEWGQDVLVGTIAPIDLSNSLKNNLYRTAVNSVKHPNTIRCVALYQSKDKFGTQSGVKHWGYVKDWVEINIEGVAYYEFHVVSWRHLKKYISINEVKNGTRYTNLFALRNSQNTAELFADSKETWRFLYEMRRILAFELAKESEVELYYGKGRFVFDAIDVNVYRKDSIEPVFTETIEHFNQLTSSKIKKIMLKLDN